jgi:hypothetical protein
MIIDYKLFRKLKVRFFLLSISINVSVTFSQTNNYKEYHHLINRAECFYFKLYNVDSSLKYYKLAFEKYNFVFIRDALNASQIAFFNNEPQHWKYFIKKAVSVGFNVKYLDSFPIFKGKYKLSVELKNECDSIYECYLKKIRQKNLANVVNMYIIDQQDKNKETSVYKKTQKKLMEQILNLIQLNEMPTEQNIGIFDEELFQRNILDSNMFQYMINRYKHTDYFKGKKLEFCSEYLYIILIHNFDAYSIIEPFFEQLIINGDIHPRTAGLLFDNMFRVNLEYQSNYKLYKIDKEYYDLNYFTKFELMYKYKKKPIVSENIINQTRKKWGINTLEIDQIKESQEVKYGFRFRHGFNKHL